MTRPRSADFADSPPPKHPLLKVERLTLEAIAKYPLITYDFAFTGRSAMQRAFEHKGLVPNVVLTAIDSDIIKTYVSLGLGIGILASMAFDAAPLICSWMSQRHEKALSYA